MPLSISTLRHSGETSQDVAASAIIDPGKSLRHPPLMDSSSPALSDSDTQSQRESALLLHPSAAHTYPRFRHRTLIFPSDILENIIILTIVLVALESLLAFPCINLLRQIGLSTVKYF